MSPDHEEGGTPNDAPPSGTADRETEERVVGVLEDYGVPADAAPEAAEQIIEVTQEGTTGAFPPPSMLSAYETIVPGMAASILAMAENAAATEVQERIDIAHDRRTLIAQRGRGQVLAFALTSTIIVAASVFFAVGNTTAGIAFLGSDVILVSIALAGGVVDLPKRRRHVAEDDAEEPDLKH